MHGHTLSMVWVVFSIGAMIGIGELLEKLGVFSWADGRQVVLFIVVALLAAFWATARVQRLLAVECPNCGNKTLEPDLLSRVQARHNCNDCGLELSNGQPVEF